MGFRQQGIVPLNGSAALGNMDIQDGQDKQNEPFAKSCRQGFCGSGERTGHSRGRSALCLNGHKRHKSWNRQVSNLIQESGFTARSSPSKGHKRHKNGMGQDGSLILCLLCFLWLSRLPHWPGSGSFPGRSQGKGHSRGQSSLCCFMEMLDSEIFKCLRMKIG